VITAIVRYDRAKRRRIHHQRTIGCNDRRKAGGETPEPALPWIAPGGVDQRDLDAGTAVVDFAQHRFQAEAVAADIWLGPDLRVDRNHVALAIGLDAKAAEEDQRHAAGFDVTVEPFKGLAHSVAGQILADLDSEAIALELVGDLAGVVDGLLQRRVRVGIFRVANDQGKPVGGQGGRRENRRDRQGKDSNQCKADSHATSAQPEKRRSQPAPRRPYPTKIALSNRAPRGCQLPVKAANSRDD